VQILICLLAMMQPSVEIAIHPDHAEITWTGLLPNIPYRIQSAEILGEWKTEMDHQPNDHLIDFKDYRPGEIKFYRLKLALDMED
jgi:hypothetical protein